MTITAQERKRCGLAPGQSPLPSSGIVTCISASPKRVCRQLPVDETLDAIHRLPQRPVTHWAKLFKTAESTMRRFMITHGVKPAPLFTAKFAVIEALDGAVKAGIRLTTHEWAEKFSAKPSYIQHIAYATKLTAAIRPMCDRLNGTLSISPIRRSDTGEFCGYGKIGISTRMLRLAGLEKENDVEFRIDPEMHEIKIGKVRRTASSPGV